MSFFMFEHVDLCQLSAFCHSDVCFQLKLRYVNGKTYMEDVANALEEAKEEIFITDWW